MKQGRLTAGALLIAAVAGTIGLSACTSTSTGSGETAGAPSSTGSGQLAPTPGAAASSSAPAASGASSAPTSSAPKVLSAAASGLPRLIGSTSYGALHIGMSRSQAMATGMIQSGEALMPGCTVHAFYPGHKPTVEEEVVVSDKFGVVDITPPTSVAVHTSAGVGVGSTLAQLKAAYPGIKQGGLGYERYWTVPVPNTGNTYTFWVDEQKHVVTKTYLLKQEEDCVNS